MSQREWVRDNWVKEKKVQIIIQSGIEQQDGNVGSKDNVEGWVDEQAEMDTDELIALDNAIQPVHFLLTKVS